MNCSTGYFGCLDNLVAQYGYYVGNWKILSVINKGVNGKARTLLEYFRFLSKIFDDTMDLLR